MTIKASKPLQRDTIMLREFILGLKNTQSFIKYKDRISELNADGIGYFLSLGILSGLLSLISGIITLRIKMAVMSAILTAYLLIMMYLYKKKLRDDVDNSKLYFYLLQVPVFFITILFGTFLDTNTTFLFFIVLIAMPLFILDKPVHSLLYILIVSAVYAICDVTWKDASLIDLDLMHLIITAGASICTDMFVLHNRIRNVENSMRFRTDSEHDPLTGLYNRRGGEEKIRECIGEKIGGTFILLDIDDFKHVNDTYGHSMGDEILSSVSMTLSNSFRSSDVVMRMGGDEFIVYAPGMVNGFFVDGKLQQINRNMAEITCAQGKDNISVSMGAVINDGSYPDYDAIFNEADSLLYETKQHGKNGFRLQDKPYSAVRKKVSAKEMEVIQAKELDQAVAEKDAADSKK